MTGRVETETGWCLGIDNAAVAARLRKLADGIEANAVVVATISETTDVFSDEWDRFEMTMKYHAKKDV